MIVSKCLCCLSLKYGNYVFGVISLVLRISMATTLYFGKSSLWEYRYSNEYASDLNILFGFLFGWCVATSGVLIFALKGMYEKRSMLMFPYVIVLLIELIVLLAVTIYMCIHESLWNLLDLFLGGGINVYWIICLLSLYQHVKETEKNYPQVETVTIKTV